MGVLRVVELSIGATHAAAELLSELKDSGPEAIDKRVLRIDWVELESAVRNHLRADVNLGVLAADTALSVGREWLRALNELGLKPDWPAWLIVKSNRPLWFVPIAVSAYQDAHTGILLRDLEWYVVLRQMVGQLLVGHSWLRYPDVPALNAPGQAPQSGDWHVGLTWRCRSSNAVAGQLRFDGFVAEPAGTEPAGLLRPFLNDVVGNRQEER